ncbi:MAG: hypothetical protein ACI85Q_002323, partial [Salibacteraceae bacterium]
TGQIAYSKEIDIKKSMKLALNQGSFLNTVF